MWPGSVLAVYVSTEQLKLFATLCMSADVQEHLDLGGTNKL